MSYDPSGNSAVGAILIGAIIGFACAYIPDVVANFDDGFEWSDFNTFENNWQKYLCATLGGAVSGAFGAVGGVGWSFMGEFVGGMIENSYSFNSAKNVGYAIWTSLLSASLGGMLDITANKITKSYFSKSMSVLSKNAQKQIKKYMKNGTKITNEHALKLIKNTELLNGVLTKGFKGLNVILTFGF